MAPADSAGTLELTVLKAWGSDLSNAAKALVKVYLLDKTRATKQKYKTADTEVRGASTASFDVDQSKVVFEIPYGYDQQEESAAIQVALHTRSKSNRRSEVAGEMRMYVWNIRDKVSANNGAIEREVQLYKPYRRVSSEGEQYERVDLFVHFRVNYKPPGGTWQLNYAPEEPAGDLGEEEPGVAAHEATSSSVPEPPEPFGQTISPHDMPSQEEGGVSHEEASQYPSPNADSTPMMKEEGVGEASVKDEEVVESGPQDTQPEPEASRTWRMPLLLTVAIAGVASFSGIIFASGQETPAPKKAKQQEEQQIQPEKKESGTFIRRLLK